MGDFRLLPDSASTVSGRVDAIYFTLLIGWTFFTFLISGLILFFGIRYRRGSRADRRNPPTSLVAEAAWTSATFAVTVVLFVWGASVYSTQQTPPAETRDIAVVAKQWMWKAQHPDGRAELNELHVPIHRPVRLRMISEDVIHSFYVPAFRVKQDVLPGYYTQLWFEATKPGQYHLFCAEYCGTEHSHMRGTIVAMEPDQFAEWLSNNSGVAPEVAGRELFERFRCGNCHDSNGNAVGPSLVGIYATRVPLQDGTAVTADEQYLRNSILDPARQVVAGYRPDMPMYRGQLNEHELLQVIAYLKSLRVETARSSPAEGGEP
jgi:cytochrome c oxidase subunit 2